MGGVVTMKRVAFAVWVALAVLVAPPAYADTSGGPPMTDVSADIRSAILSLIAAEDEAWNAGDAAAFSASTLPDVVFTNIVGMFSVGRAPFQAQHEKIFTTIYKGSRLKQTLVHVALIKPDVAIVDTLTEVSGYTHLPPGSEAIDGVLKTRLEQVMVLKDGRWRVVSFHNVTINPAATGASPSR